MSQTLHRDCERSSTSHRSWIPWREKHETEHWRAQDYCAAEHSRDISWLKSDEKPRRASASPADSWRPLRQDLQHISDAVQTSRSLLDTVDEFGHPVCSRSTWERAVKFLSGYARRVWEDQGVKIDAPEILPVPDGSIDIYWSRPSYEMLLNIPANENEPASYYGDDKAGNSVKGTITSCDNKGLLLWLATRN